MLGLRVSGRQAEVIRERLAGLPVQVVLCDYRQLPLLQAGRFDRIASIGLFEHVGRRNDMASPCSRPSAGPARTMAAMTGSIPTCSPVAVCLLPVNSAAAWRVCS